ncbi:MAG: hypothetical protein ACP5O8_04060 [Candidatus Aenigmatarchaeota archaeon]
MGIVEWLKTPEGAFIVALPVGYFGGRWVEGKLNSYLQKNREVMRESIKQAVREGIGSATNGGSFYSDREYMTKILRELQEIRETLTTKYQELDSRISRLENYEKRGQ